MEPSATPQTPTTPHPIPSAKRFYAVTGRERRLLLLVLLLATMGAEVLLPITRCWPGLGITLFVFGWEGLLGWYRGPQKGPAARLLTGAVLLLALTFTLFASRWLYLWNLVFLPALLTIQMFQGTARRAWWEPGMIPERLVLLWEGLTGRLGSAFQTLRSRRPGQGRGKGLSPVAVGLLIAVPIFLGALVLLTSADALFDQLVGRLLSVPSVRLGKLAGRLLLGALATPFLFGLLYALGHPSQRRDVGRPPVRRLVDPAVVLPVLVALDLLYVAFLAVQSAALFGGEAYLAAHGIGYAQYARSGFFQLVWVACANLAVVVAGTHVTEKEGRLWRAAQVLSTFMVALSGLLLASACWRMTLYVGQYGLSLKRLLTYWGMALLLLLFLAALGKIWRDRGFFRHLFAAGVAGWLALNYLCPEALVARYNVRAWQEGRGSVDAAYLLQLSDDALPALGELPGEWVIYWSEEGWEYTLADCLKDRRQQAARAASRWETWSLSAWRAAGAAGGN